MDQRDSFDLIAEGKVDELAARLARGEGRWAKRYRHVLRDEPIGDLFALLTEVKYLGSRVREKSGAVIAPLDLGRATQVRREVATLSSDLKAVASALERAAEIKDRLRRALNNPAITGMALTAVPDLEIETWDVVGALLEEISQLGARDEAKELGALAEAFDQTAKLRVQRGSQQPQPDWYKRAVEECRSYWRAVTNEEPKARSGSDPLRWSPFAYFFYDVMVALDEGFTESMCENVLKIHNFTAAKKKS